MVCSKKGTVSEVHFDEGDICLYDNGNKSQIELFFEWKNSSIKRWSSRYTLRTGSRSQGDHIFAISTFSLTMCHLFSGLSNEAARQKILNFFHPIFKKLYAFNQEYLAINFHDFNDVRGLEVFVYNFKQLYEVLNKLSNKVMISNSQGAVYDYLEKACFFYNNLPLLVYCEGPANPGTGEAQGNNELRLLKQRQQMDKFDQIVNILPRVIDKNALTKLIQRSNEKSYQFIIGDFILQVLLIFSSLVEISRWDTWLSLNMSFLLNSDRFKTFILSFFDRRSFEEPYNKARSKILFDVRERF